MSDHFSLIDQAYQCSNWDEIRDTGLAFTQQSGFRHFFILGSFFNNYNNPYTRVVTNYCKTPKYRYATSIHDMLGEIIEHGMMSVSPIIRGKLKTRRPYHRNFSSNIKHIRREDMHTSITFPVHFPTGQFALFHMGTHTQNPVQYQTSMIFGFQFALAICNTMFRFIERPYSDLHLSDQEKRCLIMACDGISPKLTSEQLGLSVHTIQYYLKNARRKTQSKNLQHALSRAISRGAIKPQTLTGSKLIS